MEKLKNDDLEKVAGGASNGENMSVHRGKFVDKYSLEVGKKYILYSSAGTGVYNVGVLVRSYEKDASYGSTRRVHVLNINGKECEFQGDFCSAYEYI